MPEERRKKMPKPDNPAQSRAFIEKAKELEAANGRGKADALIGTLAKMKPEPRKPKAGKRVPARD
jgi:hypothetical protein